MFDSGDVILDSDWLPSRVGNVLRYGAESRRPSQCIKIGNACIKIAVAFIKIGNSIR